MARCGFSDSLGRRGLLNDALALVGSASLTANAIRLVPALQELAYVPSAQVRHCLDAIVLADGPSMVAFIAAGMGWMAVRERQKLQVAPDQSKKMSPLAVSFASGAGLSAGFALVGL